MNRSAQKNTWRTCENVNRLVKNWPYGIKKWSCRDFWLESRQLNSIDNSKVILVSGGLACSYCTHCDDGPWGWMKWVRQIYTLRSVLLAEKWWIFCEVMVMRYRAGRGWFCAQVQATPTYLDSGFRSNILPRVSALVGTCKINTALSSYWTFFCSLATASCTAMPADPLNLTYLDKR